MPLSKRKLQPEKSREEKQREYTDQVAYELYQNRLLLERSGDAESDWVTADKIVRSPVRTTLFASNRPLIKLEKKILEPMVAWANNLALLDLLSIVGNVGLIIAVGMYIGSEKQRRDTEVLTAWQTITNAQGQPGSGGRMQALEFLNASPRNEEYAYPGANWRRRAICLWICTWKPESLAGIDLSVDTTDIPEANTQDTSLHETTPNNNSRRVFLNEIQLPSADLWGANLEGADLWYANLKGANLRAANLEGANLRAANLEGADLQSTNFEGADLWGANLEGTDLWGANLEGANLGNTNLEDADLGYANLEDADLGVANLKGADLGYANFKGANLRAANLKGADLQSTNLEGAYLGDTNLEGADLWGTNLEGANLGVVNLKGANLRAANLKGADLQSTNLEGADLGVANLEGAKKITQQQISQAKLCGTKLPPNISLDPNRDCNKLGINPETGNRE